jgi:hypothetical protein
MSWSKNYTISEYVQLAGEQPTPGYNITSPEVAARADVISQSYPWMQPQTIMSLAKYNLSQSTIQMVGNAAARRELGQYDAKKNAQGEMIAPARYAFDAIGWVAKPQRPRLTSSFRGQQLRRSRVFINHLKETSPLFLTLR